MPSPHFSTVTQALTFPVAVISSQACARNTLTIKITDWQLSADSESSKSTKQYDSFHVLGVLAIPPRHTRRSLQINMSNQSTTRAHRMSYSPEFLQKDIGTERLKRHSVAELKVHADPNNPVSPESDNILPSAHDCISSPIYIQGQDRYCRQRKQAVFSNKYADGQKHASLMQPN